MLVEEVSLGHLVVLLLVGVVGIELARWWWRRSKYDLHKIPQPKGVPLLGHAHLLPLGNKPRLTKKFHEWALKYGRVFRLNIMGENIVVIHDPKFVEEQLYTSGHADIPKAPSYLKFNKMISPYNISGIFTSMKSDAKYKSFRKTMAGAFSSEALKRGYPTFLAKAKQFASKIQGLTKDGSSCDVQDLGVRYSFDCIGHFAYGLDFNSVDNKEHPLLEALEFATEDSMAGYTNPLWEHYKTFMPFTAIAKKTRKMYQQLYYEYGKIIKAIDLEGPPPEEDDKSIRAQLIRLKNPMENDRKATPEEQYVEAISFIIAGTDTTGHQLGWILMCISTHLDVQDRVFEELKEKGLAGEGSRDPDYTDFASLTYLNKVLKECLRRVPAANSGSMRRLENDIVALGYRIPKGTILNGQAATLNICPWVWENGDKFDPERWNTQEGSETKNPSQKIFTFGLGTRNCVGQRLAMLQLQLLLVVLLSKFRFTLDPRMGGFEGAFSRGYNSLVFACEGGMWLRAVPRNELV